METIKDTERAKIVMATADEMLTELNASLKITMCALQSTIVVSHSMTNYAFRQFVKDSTHENVRLLNELTSDVAVLISAYEKSLEMFHASEKTLNEIKAAKIKKHQAK